MQRRNIHKHEYLIFSFRISHFCLRHTLLANCKEGNRPSFIGAGSPDEAKRLYEYMVELGKKSDIHTECGVFGADMKVSLENDGPFTIVLEL